MRDILRGKEADIQAALKVIAHIDPDILLLTGMDYDLSNATLTAFAEALDAKGANYPHVFARMPNGGMQTGLDMNGDGRLGSARDAQGYGRYAGANGMALLSRYPISENVRDFSQLLWKDFPDADLPTKEGVAFPSQEAQDVQRLSSSGHWDVPVETPNGILHLFAYAATPPVFDGPEDLNGKRSADETRFWSAYLNGSLSQKTTKAPFIILGKSNQDPNDGDGIHQAMRDLLDHPRVQDPLPKSIGGKNAANPEQKGDPALDTANWADGANGPGNLRVDYVLPSSELQISASGVFWPPADSKGAALLIDGKGFTRHRLVWVDVTLP